MSTMTESFFKENFNETLPDISDYVKITAANGLQSCLLDTKNQQ